MRGLPWVLVAIFLAAPGIASGAGQGKHGRGDGGIDVPAERPFDAVNMFGDFGRSLRLPNADENMLWWERMVRGQVGKDRFLILCALKGGEWKRLGDIGDYVEFQTGEIYGSKKLQWMLVLMAGIPGIWPAGRPDAPRTGEGWLEKKPGGITGPDSLWRIEPSVYPLLYFLLMGCPEDNRCGR